MTRKRCKRQGQHKLRK